MMCFIKSIAEFRAVLVLIPLDDLLREESVGLLFGILSLFAFVDLPYYLDFLLLLYICTNCSTCLYSQCLFVQLPQEIILIVGAFVFLLAAHPYSVVLCLVVVLQRILFLF